MQRPGLALLVALATVAFAPAAQASPALAVPAPAPASSISAYGGAGFELGHDIVGRTGPRIQLGVRLWELPLWLRMSFGTGFFRYQDLLGAYASTSLGLEAQHCVAHDTCLFAGMNVGVFGLVRAKTDEEICRENGLPGIHGELVTALLPQVGVELGLRRRLRIALQTSLSTIDDSHPGAMLSVTFLGPAPWARR